MKPVKFFAFMLTADSDNAIVVRAPDLDQAIIMATEHYRRLNPTLSLEWLSVLVNNRLKRVSDLK